jgi:hypothetical protein
LFAQGDAQVAIGFDIVRFQLQRATAAGNRFVQLSLVLEDSSQIAMKNGFRPVYPNRTRNVFDRVGMPSLPGGDDSQQVERIRMMWIGDENLPVDLLG